MKTRRKSKKKSPAPGYGVNTRIHWIRGQAVMFDFDLAVLYGVETRALVQGVKRNIARFPEDFMFQLTAKEFEDWRSQVVISNPGARMGLRREPYVFTEHGVAMLASVLRSQKAVDVSIHLVRAFIRMRKVLASHEDLARKLEEHDQQIGVLFQQMDAIMEVPEPELKKKKPIGFIAS
jgi:hypothetical protein